MIGGMKSFTATIQLGVLLLSGCSFLEPRSTFQIASADRPVKSAFLQLCKQAFALTNRDGRWQTSIKVPGDCHGGISVTMSDRRRIFCSIGYVTVNDGSHWFFTIKGDGCRSRVTYGDAGSGNGS
ncbi:hypothetical protein QCD71_19595 [Sphingomonas sp. PsM26]|jgi:hypothetical protein|nr:hypothetical protein [Sphingomonas sp. PsM26]